MMNFRKNIKIICKMNYNSKENKFKSEVRYEIKLEQ